MFSVPVQETLHPAFHLTCLSPFSLSWLCLLHYGFHFSRPSSLMALLHALFLCFVHFFFFLHLPTMVDVVLKDRKKCDVCRRISWCLKIYGSVGTCMWLVSRSLEFVYFWASKILSEYSFFSLGVMNKQCTNGHGPLHRHHQRGYSTSWHFLEHSMKHTNFNEPLQGWNSVVYKNAVTVIQVL